VCKYQPFSVDLLVMTCMHYQEIKGVLWFFDGICRLTGKVCESGGQEPESMEPKKCGKA
jgi:hypothetical protein